MSNNRSQAYPYASRPQVSMRRLSALSYVPFWWWCIVAAGFGFGVACMWMAVHDEPGFFSSRYVGLASDERAEYCVLGLVWAFGWAVTLIWTLLTDEFRRPLV